MGLSGPWGEGDEKERKEDERERMVGRIDLGMWGVGRGRMIEKDEKEEGMMMLGVGRERMNRMVVGRKGRMNKMTRIGVEGVRERKNKRDCVGAWEGMMEEGQQERW